MLYAVKLRCVFSADLYMWTGLKIWSFSLSAPNRPMKGLHFWQVEKIPFYLLCCWVKQIILINFCPIIAKYGQFVLIVDQYSRTAESSRLFDSLGFSWQVRSPWKYRFRLLQTVPVQPLFLHWTAYLDQSGNISFLRFQGVSNIK